MLFITYISLVGLVPGLNKLRITQGIRPVPLCIDLIVVKAFPVS